jgi:serine/threonine protein kinase
MKMGPGERVERYEVIRLLGAGGMAQVYLVRHVTLETLHALKVLTLTSRALQARMQEEGRVQAQLRHDNVVHVSDVLQVGGMPALVMEYVDGPDLHHWIRTVRPDSTLAEQVFRGILAGLGAAHRAGLVHRDLKPANVLMAQDAQGRWVPKIADFGLVKVVTASASPLKTRSGMAMGTPEYMAPEQIRDPSRVDHRADLFSLGCILYELLNHERAYDGPDILSIFQAIEEGRRAPLDPSVPSRLAALVNDCLQVAPERRPADCETITRRLDAPAPVVVQPTPPPRTPLWPLGLGAALVSQLGCLGLWGALWLALPSHSALPEPSIPPPELPAPPREAPAPRKITGGPCPGAPGERVGWFYTRPHLLAGRPSQGTLWSLSSPKEVVADYQKGGPVVCRLEAGMSVQIEQDPIRDGKGYWVPLHAGSVRTQ